MRNSVHPLHEYVGDQIAGRLRERHVVVLYDPREEFRIFMDELPRAQADGGLVSVKIGGQPAKLCVFDGSFLQVRFAVEPFTSGENPEHVLIYLPGVQRDDKGSILMELEKAGTCYRPPALKQLARIVLRRRYTDVAIDDLLKSDALSYSDLARMCMDDGDSKSPSILKSIYGVSDAHTILSSWIADTGHDSEIESKGAIEELRAAILTGLGLSLPDDANISRMRANTSRYVLANEFRLDLAPAADLQAPSLAGLKSIPAPETEDHERAIREICRRLRERHSEAYISAADRVEGEIGLSALSISGDKLGAIDTFRFEEHAVAATCFDLIASDKFQDAQKLIDTREKSFWIDHYVERKTLWEACRFMIDLGLAAQQAGQKISKANGNPVTWVNLYVSQSDDSWFHLDRCQRRLETLIPEIEEDIDEKALARIRVLYEEVVRRMSEGFIKALEKCDWNIGGILPQTRIWADVVAPTPRPIAYILVDAMRYEIGFELFERIKRFGEVQLRPAIAALPSITPVGMAALLPGASSSFSIVEQNSRFGSLIDGSFLPDLQSRQKLFKNQASELVDITLDEALSSNAKTLQKKIENAKVIVIRSTEIDAAGENTGTLYARRIMEGVVEDIAKCLKRLVDAGIENAVITADHGHLFFAADRDHSMRIDAPGGDTVDLHRRCWIGRGGATPPGSVRIQGAKLGYVTDLDIVLPSSTSVFKAGGDLAYHHGGASLQELVIPVITAKLKRDGVTKTEKDAISVAYDFSAVTNRIFSIRVELGGSSKTLFETARVIRPIVISEDRQVAKASVAVGAQIEDGKILLEPQKPVTIGFILTDDGVNSVRIQILDAETDAVLYVSPKDIPVRLGV